jgi:membrane protein
MRARITSWVKKQACRLWDAGSGFVARRFPRLAALLAPYVAYAKRWILFFRDVTNEFLTDNCPHLAASISFYVLLSLFPLTLALVSVLGFISHSPEMQARIIDGIGNFLPVSRDFITKSIESVVSTRAITGVIGVVGLIIGGNAVFTAVRKSLNAAWGIRQPRPFWTERLVEFCMLLGAAILIFLSLALTSALSIVQQQNITVFGTNSGLFWNLVTGGITTVIVFIVFLLLYKFVPNKKIRWRDIWLGALLAAIGFEATTSVFVWYMANFAHYNLIYGPLGGLVALMIWVYVSAVIFLYCAKMTAVHSRKPAPTDEVLAKLWTAVAEVEQRSAAEATEQIGRLRTAVADLEQQLTTTVDTVEETGRRGIKSLMATGFGRLKRTMSRKTSPSPDGRASQSHHNDGSESAESATSSPREQPPQ